MDDIHPIAPDKRAAILSSLADIEQRHDVRVLLACESGSRGWGFSSPDSDYDARFIYVHRQPWYLSVNESTGPGEAQRDVIELPIDDELDVSGWDLRKALRLVSKSNPTLIEWLRSPIIYQQDHTAVSQLWKAAESFYSPLGTWWHYFNMARSNHRGYLRGETVRTKKYLYVLRPLLACQWIEHEQTPRRWPSRICWTGCCRTARCVKPSMPCWRLNAPVPRSVPDRASRRSAISSIVNWPSGLSRRRSCPLDRVMRVAG
jgi:hypothetical protein